MHLHLVHDAAKVEPKPLPRPAKVVQLEARRQAREAPRLERPRPAA